MERVDCEGRRSDKAKKEGRREPADDAGSRVIESRCGVGYGGE